MPMFLNAGDLSSESPSTRVVQNVAGTRARSNILLRGEDDARHQQILLARKQDINMHVVDG